MNNLVSRTDPILKTVMDKFDFANPPVDPIDLAKVLAEAVISHNGLGIAANQLGLPYRAFAIKAEQIIVCFNPIIVDASEEIISLEEGCLTYPHVYVNIKRPRKIKVRYTQPNGEVVTRVFEGMTARIFQHELDHLNGLVHLDKVNRYHREKAQKDAKLNPRRPVHAIDQKLEEVWDKIKSI